MSIVVGLSAPGGLTVEGGREKSPGLGANCKDFEIGSVDVVKQASPLIDRERNSEFDSSPCDFGSYFSGGGREQMSMDKMNQLTGWGTGRG